MSSGDISLQPRDQKILDHIGRYRMTLRPVLDRLFFADESSGCGNVLKRLIDAGLVTARDGLPSKRRYYQLTAKGAEGRVPLGRTKPMRAQSLRSAIAILWFCTMGDSPRTRIESWELRDILADEGLVLTANDDFVPEVPKRERIEFADLGQGFWRVVAHYGFMETPSVPEIR